MTTTENRNGEKSTCDKPATAVAAAWANSAVNSDSTAAEAAAASKEENKATINRR